jgi:hypothetical protein
MSGRRSNGHAVGEEGMTCPNVMDLAFRDHTSGSHLEFRTNEKNVRNHSTP